MKSTPAIRRGKPLCISVDADADALLRAMAPHSRGLGYIVSELIRREAERRAERPQLLATLAAMQAEVEVGTT